MSCARLPSCQSARDPRTRWGCPGAENVHIALCLSTSGPQCPWVDPVSWFSMKVTARTATRRARCVADRPRRRAQYSHRSNTAWRIPLVVTLAPAGHLADPLDDPLPVRILVVLGGVVIVLEVSQTHPPRSSRWWIPCRSGRACRRSRARSRASTRRSQPQTEATASTR